MVVDLNLELILGLVLVLVVGFGLLRFAWVVWHGLRGRSIWRGKRSREGASGCFCGRLFTAVG